MPRRCVTAARLSFAVPVSVSFAYETRASEAQVSFVTKPEDSSPSSRRVIPDAVEQDPLGEVDPPQHPAVGVREVQQHLVVVQRQSVLALQLRGQLPRDRRVRTEKRDPGLELLWWGDRLRAHSHCALKYSGSARRAGAARETLSYLPPGHKGSRSSCLFAIPLI